MAEISSTTTEETNDPDVSVQDFSNEEDESDSPSGPHQKTISMVSSGLLIGTALIFDGALK